MAQEGRGSTGDIPVAGIVALVLFASGLFVHHQPLQSDRPASEIRTSGPANYGQDAEARLWQDPLDAVQRAKKPLKQGPQDYHRPDFLRTQINTVSSAGKRVLVLPVMIFGGPYAEDGEERRRSRYAVLAGLQASKFEPMNSRGVGFVRFGADHQDLPAVVPFERWDAIEDTKDGFDTVFVIWLTEEIFSRNAAPLLDSLFKEILPTGANEPVVKILGPSSINTLNGIDSSRQCGTELNSFKIYGKCREFIAPRLSSPRASEALRLSPADDRLVGLLIQELRNRDVALPRIGEACSDHIALVVEADTHYGRSLEDEFRNQLSSCAPDKLHVFRYFRGLDGKVAAAGEPGKTESAARDAAKRDPIPPQERAQGQGQFDYLLRIAAAVREIDDELERKARADIGSIVKGGRRSSIRAVVVLGSDIYDRLAIFHALRERLPYALFATTDLDAGLLQADQLNWTRNVIVASGPGFKFEAKVQAGAPPFRDTYQTATFLGTRLALASDKDDALKPTRLYSRTERLFEIGNTREVELTPIDGTAPAQDRSGIAGRIGLALGLAAIFGYIFSWCLRKAVRSRWIIAGLAAAAAVAAYIGRILEIADQAGEEPLLWLEGVSVWPTELIRICVVLLAVVMSIRCWIKFREGKKELGEDFFPNVRAKSLCLKDLLPSADCPNSKDEVDVNGLWQQYRAWTSGRFCAVRIVTAVVLYVLLAWLLIAIDPPVVPVRGLLSRQIDTCTTIVAVFSMLFLLITVLDGVAMTTLFLRRLYGPSEGDKPSNWSKAILEKYCGCSGGKAARSYVDLRLSAKLTCFVGDIVLYPFVLALLMILSRSRFIDDWVMPRGLLIVIIIGLALVAISAFSLRYYAEKIRRFTLCQLADEDLVACSTAVQPAAGQQGATSEQRAKMREIAAGLREGAFAAMSEQPIIRALILPLGGTGLVSLIDYAMFMKW